MYPAIAIEVGKAVMEIMLKRHELEERNATSNPLFFLDEQANEIIRKHNAPIVMRDHRIVSTFEIKPFHGEDVVMQQKHIAMVINMAIEKAMLEIKQVELDAYRIAMKQEDGVTKTTDETCKECAKDAVRYALPLIVWRNAQTVVEAIVRDNAENIGYVKIP